ncbi:hypothetical protein PV433_30950 [Paenibacillus sp. GYB004]|uniref:hypothetical protein n=1 Tax=Paenibacillus sp. GYB004 TaxID=2994393 RepID=UPI002F96DF90
MEGTKPMNNYDQLRKDALVRALVRAKEKAEICRLYLVANDRDPDEIAAASLAVEHIEIALGHLGVMAERDF